VNDDGLPARWYGGTIGIVDGRVDASGTGGVKVAEEYIPVGCLEGVTP